MVQSAKVPLAFCSRTSASPSPLKSPRPETFQAEPSVTVAPCEVISCDELICDPFMVQSANVPLLLRRKTSALPSPLRSATPSTVHAGARFTALPPAVTLLDDAIADPLMVQSTKEPLPFRNRTSARPSPL